MLNNSYYQNNLANAYAIPQEKLAIRGALMPETTSKIAAQQASEQANALDFSNRRNEIVYDINAQRKNLNTSAKQNAIATGISIGNVGLAGYNAYNKYQQSKEEKKMVDKFMKNYNFFNHMLYNEPAVIIKQMQEYADKWGINLSEGL